jgi:hypothetical protein
MLPGICRVAIRVGDNAAFLRVAISSRHGIYLIFIVKKITQLADLFYSFFHGGIVIQALDARLQRIESKQRLIYALPRLSALVVQKN